LNVFPGKASFATKNHCAQIAASAKDFRKVCSA
jgi:hypothetical protein